MKILKKEEENEMAKAKIMCAQCQVKEKICRLPHGHGPDYCPTVYEKDLIQKTRKEYKKPTIRKFALNEKKFVSLIFN